jgi:ribosomal protein S27AE
MSCHKAWSRDTLVSNFTSKFVTKTYKERREALLNEREKALMPATQPYVELERLIRRKTQEIVQLKFASEKEERTLRKIQNTHLAVLAVEHGLANEGEAFGVRARLEADQRKIIASFHIDITCAQTVQNHMISQMHGRSLENERRAFVRACPHADCKGFLSTAWKCGLCENWTCPTCHEVKGPEKDAEHTCNPDNVATAELLARDTRNCPKCATGIFKINGCDQMWCTQCHTAFSWRTGRIETHTVHNPHYFEYQRTHGTPLPRQPGDIPCGGFPEWGQVNRLLPRPELNSSGYRSHTASVAEIVNAYRSHPHAMFALIPRYTEPDRQTENRDLRIKFMIGDITEDQFKKKIQQREKANQRKRAIQQVLEMYTTVVTDLFQAFLATKDVGVLHTSLCGLRDHYNATLQRVQFTYKCAVPNLLANFNFRV